MRSISSAARWLTGLLTAGLLLGACGGGGSEDDASDGQSVEEEVGFDKAGLRLRQRSVEELIRDCMKAAGFEYTPVDPAAADAALLGSANVSDDEFKEQFGYGISTLYERRAQRLGDPNAAIRDALSPADQAAYDHALRGASQDATFFLAVDSGDFSQLGGCTMEATETVFGGAEVLSTMVGKLDELEERINNDPRMVAALRRWVTCVRDEGFSFAQPDDVDHYLQDKLEAIVGSEPGAQDYDTAALAALQQEEMAIAEADYGCEDKVISPVEDEVVPEYERSFREDNAGLINAVGKG
jgi:hypothetical protein